MVEDNWNKVFFLQKGRKKDCEYYLICILEWAGPRNKSPITRQSQSDVETILISIGRNPTQQTRPSGGIRRLKGRFWFKRNRDSSSSLSFLLSLFFTDPNRKRKRGYSLEFGGKKAAFFILLLTFSRETSFSTLFHVFSYLSCLFFDFPGKWSFIFPLFLFILFKVLRQSR